LGQGAEVAAFEDAVASYLGAKNVVAVSTGTTALQLALLALDIGPGDEVIVPSLTFCASVQAITACGATPVFCEVNRTNLNIDVDDARKRISGRTRVIMPVHYCGNACDMDALQELSEDAGVTIVEDAAHAFGSKYKGRMLGSFGQMTCFSFDPIKNITSGEGGAIVTDCDETAARLRKMRMLGIDRNRPSGSGGEYDVIMQGYRFHMSNINAAIGIAQMERVEQFKRRKTEVVKRYNAVFSGLKDIALLDWNFPDTFPFTYVLRVAPGKRDAFRKHLEELKVGTGMHYPPNHLLTLFADRRTSLPWTEELAREIVTLPLYFEMSDEDVERVVEGVCSFSIEKSNVA
jgi:perosamine synthetase